jgi:anaerobic selenocysteine-containing dehydrogenase
MSVSRQEMKEDIWIPTVCGMCYGGCAMRARRVNGTVVKLEGFPGSSQGNGRLCSKGIAGLQNLYDPNRINYPMKRTNPAKGIGVDPKWERISWDEAQNILVRELGKILKDDPRKIFFQGTTIHVLHMTWGLFPLILGTLETPNFWVSGGGVHCGQGAHMVSGFMHASWDIVPDWDYCNYAVLFGSSHGTAAGHSMNVSCLHGADFRSRGGKLVVFDPVCNFVGGKATEWIPIVPGTDTIVIMAMVNVILNERGVWDSQYLKYKTNAPYLIGPDGRIIRDKENNKPLLWDCIDDREKPFDAPIKDLALEGTYEVDGVEAQPVFQKLMEHVKKFTCEWASEVSSVPANTIRRIAIEFSEAAKIGSTITIQGKEVPYRPAAVAIFRGAQGHTNTLHACMAAALMTHLVGSADVCGGTIGWPARCLGYAGTDRLKFEPYADKDGMMVPGRWLFKGKNIHVPSCHYPDISFPVSSTRCTEAWPMNTTNPFPGWSDQEEIWEKCGLPYRIEGAINFGSNSVMSMAQPENVDRFFKKIPFVASFDIFSTEFAESYADLILPDTCYLEEYSIQHLIPLFNLPYGMSDWAMHIRQPIVEPLYERRQMIDVMMEVIDRLGLWEKWIQIANDFLEIKDSYKLDPKKKYKWADIMDAHYKSEFGPEHDLKWFKQHGGIIWPKKVEEAYWRPFLNVRVPIYMEWMVDMYEQVKRKFPPRGIMLDFDQYTPLVDWFPCPPHKERRREYDLYAFSYRDVLHTGTWTMQLPYIDEASRMNPYTYTITMNIDTARKKGLRDGDAIWVENNHGHKVKGVLQTMEGMHPECLGIAACSGHWAKNMPIARGKGTHFNVLLEADLEHSCPLTVGLETCTKAKVYKE